MSERERERVCVCVGVCVCEREREREGERLRERDSDSQRERERVPAGLNFTKAVLLPDVNSNDTYVLSLPYIPSAPTSVKVKQI